MPQSKHRHSNHSSPSNSAHKRNRKDSADPTKGDHESVLKAKLHRIIKMAHKDTCKHVDYGEQQTYRGVEIEFAWNDAKSINLIKDLLKDPIEGVAPLSFSETHCDHEGSSLFISWDKNPHKAFKTLYSSTVIGDYNRFKFASNDAAKSTTEADESSIPSCTLL